MNKKDDFGKLARIDEGFHSDLKEVQRERILKGKDKPSKPNGVSRLTQGIHRHPLFKNILKDLKKADLPKSKKGSFQQISTIIVGIVLFIVASIVIIFIGAIWMTQFGTFTDILTNLPNQDATYNVSQYADTTFGNINTAFQTFRWWAIMIFFGLAIGLLMTNFLVKVHPAFFIVYVLVAIIMIFLSIMVANSYENIYTDGGLVGQSLQSVKGASLMIIYLPVWITIISIIGGIFLFVNIGRDDSQGEFI